MKRAAPKAFVLCGVLSVVLLAVYPRKAGPVTVFAPILLGLTFAALLSLILQAHPESRWRTSFETKFLGFFGKYSYGLYVFHFLFFPVWLSIHRKILAATGVYRLAVLGSATTAIVTAIGISMLSWRFMEQPLLKYKGYFEAGTLPP